MSTTQIAGGACALLMLAAPQTLLAQDVADGTGFYIGADVGIASISDAEIVYNDGADSAGGQIDTDSAASFGGVLGYDFGTVRTDLEIDYSRNKISALTIDTLNGTAVNLTAQDRADICDFLEVDTCGGSGNTFEFDGSRVRQLSAMANLWLDLPIGSVITPYAGGGLGIAGFELDGEGEGKFAWQIGAGLAFNVSPSAALSLDFRHRQVSSTEIEYDESSGFELGKLETNTFSAGVRFTF